MLGKIREFALRRTCLPDAMLLAGISCMPGAGDVRAERIDDKTQRATVNFSCPWRWLPDRIFRASRPGSAREDRPPGQGLVAGPNANHVDPGRGGR